MLTRTDIQTILDQITYKEGWKLFLGDTDLYLQVQFEDYDHDNPDLIMLQKCRKWRLTGYMTPSEIVRTAYKAILAAEEHEASELFKYRGVDIYNPHTDVDVLVNTRLQLGDSMLSRRT